MAKKNKRKKLSGDEDAQDFGHNPFAAALGLDRPPEDTSESSKTSEATFSWSSLTKVILRRERKGRGGKTVTLIQGLQDVPQEALDELAATVKKSLSVGVSIEGDELVVQGDQRERLLPIVEKLGVTSISQSG